MCYFIKLVLPSEVDPTRLGAIAKRHQRLLAPTSEAGVHTALRPEERVYLTSGNCDCDSGLASSASSRREHDAEREVAKLRRNGWSEAKIQRWREQRGAVEAGKAASAGRARAEDAERWRALLSEILDAEVEQVGLVLHWVTNEFRRGPAMPRASLTVEALSGLEGDVLYTFTRRT